MLVVGIHLGLRLGGGICRCCGMVVDTVLVDLLVRRADMFMLLCLALAYTLVFDLEVAFADAAV